MKTRVYNVKDVDEAIVQASVELRIPEDDLVVKILDEKQDEEGNTYQEVEVTVGIDGIEKGKQFLQSVLDFNNIDGLIEKRIRDNIVEFNINAQENNGYLIGKNQKYLLALQILVNNIINNYYDEEEQMIVKLDVGGYRRRRESNLERLAVEYGKQVVKTKQVITLDGLNSYERKIIHDRLSTWKELNTHSEGVEPNRNLIIEYVTKKNTKKEAE